MARRRREQTIFFAWERRSGWLQVPWLRSRALLAALVTIVVLLLLGMRERRLAGARSTRARLLVVREALDAFRADHHGTCPPTLDQLKNDGYLTVLPRDAWGRLFQLTCPGRRNPHGYDLASLGPNGDRRGLERIE